MLGSILSYLSSAPTALSFAGAESDFSQSVAADRALQQHGGVSVLSASVRHRERSALAAANRASAEYARFLEASLPPNASARSDAGALSFASPESDFTGATAREAVSAAHAGGGYTLEAALAPSFEARVLTSAETPFTIAHVNEAWTQLCGFTSAEVCGKTLEIIQGPATDARDLAALVGSLEGEAAAAAPQELTAVTLTNYTKSGRAFQNELKVTPVRDQDSGAVTHFLGVLKRIEAESEQEEARKATAA